MEKKNCDSSECLVPFWARVPEVRQQWSRAPESAFFSYTRKYGTKSRFQQCPVGKLANRYTLVRLGFTVLLGYTLVLPGFTVLLGYTLVLLGFTVLLGYSRTSGFSGPSGVHSSTSGFYGPSGVQSSTSGFYGTSGVL